MGVKLAELFIVFGMLRTDKPRMIGIVGDYIIFKFFALHSLRPIIMVPLQNMNLSPINSSDKLNVLSPRYLLVPQDIKL